MTSPVGPSHLDGAEMKHYVSMPNVTFVARRSYIVVMTLVTSSDALVMFVASSY